MKHLSLGGSRLLYTAHITLQRLSGGPIGVVALIGENRVVSAKFCSIFGIDYSMDPPLVSVFHLEFALVLKNALKITLTVEKSL